MKIQLVHGLARMNADPDNPRESAFIRVPFSHQATCLPAPITDENVKFEPTLYTVCIASGRAWYEGRLQVGTTSLNIRLTGIP